jgi:hypothetical protein
VYDIRFSLLNFEWFNLHGYRYRPSKSVTFLCPIFGPHVMPRKPFITGILLNFSRVQKSGKK